MAAESSSLVKELFSRPAIDAGRFTRARAHAREVRHMCIGVERRDLSGREDFFAGGATPCFTEVWRTVGARGMNGWVIDQELTSIATKF
ncbi:MAG TPA: hypothetical protein VH518_14370 [Tepidisphaeraceae bacterium]|jgi:hypothetical protein